MYRRGGDDAVDRTLELDVHQHEVGLELAGERHRVVAAGRLPDGDVTECLQLEDEVAGNDEFVFNNEDTGVAHGRCV